MENWKTIKDTDGNYLVSDLGRIKSLPRKVKFGNTFRITDERILKPKNHTGGYFQVVIIINGEYKQKYIHRLVAESFIDNMESKPQVNHKDENKKNNKVENLEWCTQKYNNNYGTARKRMVEKISIPVINITTGKVYNSARDAFRKTGIHCDGITRCCKGKVKSAGHEMKNNKRIKYEWGYYNE